MSIRVRYQILEALGKGQSSASKQGVLESSSFAGRRSKGVGCISERSRLASMLAVHPEDDMSMRLRFQVVLFFVLAVALPWSGCSEGDDANGAASGSGAADAGSDACPPGQHPDGQEGCTSDPCQPNPCTQPNQSQCVDEGGQAACHCDPGTHDAGQGCLPDMMCMPTTCGGHGTCTDPGGAVMCTCDPGYIGQFCEMCDTAGGYYPDGKGGCTQNPCDPNPCPQGMELCQVEGGMPVCHCNAGTHDENGVCVPDVTCMPTSCAGHGTCDDTGGMVSCTCDPGWAPPFCAGCDQMGGFHPDGMGGCTQDPCVPNPCTDPHKTVCTAPADQPVCTCDPGYHDEGGACVIDQVCGPSTCSGHGTCTDMGGTTSCACDPGYLGSSCDTCDTAGGYHPDGMGGCTQDPCVPNPCMAPNQTVCVSNGMTATCTCDPGYHPDGIGGCTDDPCVPNPCAAMNQACMNNGGMAECYTPVCDDMNPCTTDTLAGGMCVYAPLPDGTACSTTLCITGQTCQSTLCTGGSAVSCDDNNPCTDDSCDALMGCAHAVNTTLIPDDGIACTVDACTTGVPVHTPSDALCDDSLYCTGVELCSPSDPGANGQGCITTNVPAAPPSDGPCSYYGPCDEATMSFPLITLPPGSACDDAIGCTQNDTCDAAGVCAGIPTSTCAGDPCLTSSQLAMPIDIPLAKTGGSVTMGGQPLPQNNPASYTTTFYLQAKDTSARHQLAYFYHTSGGLWGPYFTTKLVPGVYDLVYRRDWDSSYNTVGSTAATDLIPKGMRVLATNMVIGQGTHDLAIDISVAQIAGNVTLGGQPLPANNPASYTTTIYLKAKDTGAWHQLAYFYHTSGGLWGPYFTTKLLPGEYEMLYRRDWDSTYNTVGSTAATDIIPKGMRTLASSVTIAAGANNLDIDIPVATISGSVTLGGQPLPANNPASYTTTLYLRAADTGAWHQLAYFYHTSGGLWGPYFTTKLLPGKYDLLYRRDWDSTYKTVGSTDGTDLIPKGMRVLQTDLMIQPGSNTLNIDIPVAGIAGSVTLGGQPLPANNPASYTTTLYMRSSDTGAWHQLAYFYHTSGGLWGPYFTSKLLPGTYDILYRRDWDSTYNTIGSTDATDLIPKGLRVLQTNVTVQSGANNLAIDIPVSPMSGTITLGGQMLPANNPASYTTTIYLKSKDTGAWHQLAYFYHTSGGLWGPYFTSKLLPGTYDILYRRDWDSTYNTVGSTAATDLIPKGMRTLAEDVVIAPGPATLDIDIPLTPMAGSITLAGQSLPANNPASYTTTLYLRAPDTGAWHQLAYFYHTSGGLWGPYFTSKVLPGTYDLLYRRDWDSTYNTIGSTDVTDKIPKGLRILDACVTVP